MDTNYLKYGNKYPALFGSGNCCGNDARFGTGPESRFHTPTSPASYFIGVGPDVINLEGAVGSVHSLGPVTIYAGGSPTGSSIPVHIQGPSLGTLTSGFGSNPSLDLNNGYQLTQNINYRFPTSWQTGSEFDDMIYFSVSGNPSAGTASLWIHGYVPGNPSGVGDYITLNGPSIFSAFRGSLDPNCPPQQFCNVQYSAQFFDLQGNGTTMPQWNWTLELKRPQGYTTIRSFVGTTFPYSDFMISAPLYVSPLVNWERNASGNVLGRITVSGLDSDGYPQYAFMDVDVTGIGSPVPPLRPSFSAS